MPAFTVEELDTIQSALKAVGENELAAKMDKLGGSFGLDMLLNTLGIWGKDRDTVKAAIPTAQNMVALLNTNRNVIEQIAKDWQAIGPAAQIIVSKLA